MLRAPIPRPSCEHSFALADLTLRPCPLPVEREVAVASVQTCGPRSSRAKTYTNEAMLSFRAVWSDRRMLTFCGRNYSSPR